MKYKLTKEQLDRIVGGLSDGKTVEDIAKKHGVSVEEIEKQIKIGLPIEMEHTNDEDIAREIVLDHLYESYFYYTELKKMEDKLNEKTDYSKEKKSGLHGWFSRRGGEGSEGWIDCNTCRKDSEGKTKCKPCGRKKGEKRSEYPACKSTPSACKTKGKGEKWGKKWGEKWGKKSKKNESINEVEQSEIDRILDKINKLGIDSLTKSEKLTLDNSQDKEFQSKDYLIEKIKDIVSNEGIITSGDLMLDHNPVYKQHDQEIHLIERFLYDSVEVVIYGGYKYETELGEYKVPYEELNDELIEEIYDILIDSDYMESLNEFFKLPSEIEREGKKEISEEKLNNIRELIKYYGFEINNEFINDKQDDYIEYYFDVSSKKYEGRDINIRNKVQIIAEKLGLDFGFDLNRDNLFYFFDDSNLNENSIKVSTEDLKDQKTFKTVEDLIKKEVPVELTEDLSTEDSKGELNFNPTEFTIDDVSTAMDIVEEYEKFVHTSKPKNVITWYDDKLINKIINYGVKMGWLFRPSVTQVEWTDKGIEILNKDNGELVEGKKDRCYNIAKRRYKKNSAYRSGAIVRCRKGQIWKNESKEELKNQIKEMVEKELKPTITKGEFIDLLINS